MRLMSRTPPPSVIFAFGTNEDSQCGTDKAMADLGIFQPAVIDQLMGVSFDTTATISPVVCGSRNTLMLDAQGGVSKQPWA